MVQEHEEHGEPEGARREESGAERQVGQRRRWRAGRWDGEGGLSVQFWFQKMGFSNAYS